MRSRCPLARDHKRLLDGDEGPNTGGMGAYSPLPDLPDDAAEGLLDAFHRPILAELARRGTPFRGALYAGLMLTDDGPVLLECNARFGDPETQAILPRLAVAARADPARRGARRPRRGSPGYGPRRRPAADAPGRRPSAIVLAAAGYPDAPRRGDAIEGLADAAATGALVFHAGTARDADGTVRTAGGRVLTVVGRGTDLAAARAAADAPRTASMRPGCSDGTTSAVRTWPRGRGARPMIPRYTLPEMGAIWSDTARFEAMLRVELAVARAQAARGQVPAEALAALESRARVDVDRILEIERTTDHDVIAFVSQVAESVGPEGRYLHLGLTSSDVVDTGLALQLRAAGERLLRRRRRPAGRARSRGPEPRRGR